MRGRGQRPEILEEGIRALLVQLHTGPAAGTLVCRPDIQGFLCAVGMHHPRKLNANVRCPERLHSIFAEIAGAITDSWRPGQRA